MKPSTTTYCEINIRQLRKFLENYWRDDLCDRATRVAFLHAISRKLQIPIVRWVSRDFTWMCKILTIS